MTSANKFKIEQWKNPRYLVMRTNWMWRLNRNTHRKIMQNWDEKKDLVYHNVKKMMIYYYDDHNIR